MFMHAVFLECNLYCMHCQTGLLVEAIRTTHLLGHSQVALLRDCQKGSSLDQSTAQRMLEHGILLLVRSLAAPTSCPVAAISLPWLGQPRSLSDLLLPLKFLASALLPSPFGIPFGSRHLPYGLPFSQLAVAFLCPAVSAPVGRAAGLGFGCVPQHHVCWLQLRGATARP